MAHVTTWLPITLLLDVEETLKQEEQVVSKLKIRINSMEHEHYLLELRVEREQKHKQSVTQVTSANNT